MRALARARERRSRDASGARTAPCSSCTSRDGPAGSADRVGSDRGGGLHQQVQRRAGRDRALRRRVPGRCADRVLLPRGRRARRAERPHPHPAAERRLAALLESLRRARARLAAARARRETRTQPTTSRRPLRCAARSSILRNVLKAWLLRRRRSRCCSARSAGSSAATASGAPLPRVGGAARRGDLLVRRPDRAWGWSARASCCRARRRRCTRPSSGSRSRAGVVKPKLYVLPDSYPRALSAGRGAGGGAALALSVGLMGVASPAELEGLLAHELAHLRHRDVLVQTIAVVLATVIVESSRIGGALQRALLVRPRAGRGGVRAPAALAEARVRGRPLRRRALRLAARARRRAAPPRAGDAARRRSRRARRPSRSTRRTRSPRRASRRSSSRTRRSASACGGCASSTRTGATKLRAAVERRKAPCGAFRRNNGRRPTLPGDCSPSTIGADGLNFSVRNGKRCFPVAMTAQLVRRARDDARAPSKLHSYDDVF